MITISPASVQAVLASGLIDQLDADIQQRYPGDPINGIDAAGFEAAGGYFVMAYNDGQPIGCGAFRPYDPQTVEIKRMFVSPAVRGQGVARSILKALETEARTRGYTRAILETGFKNYEAIAAYQACGYESIEVFGQYIGSPISVCFGKAL
jgi:GNAT superfamily N-acetyltransferase